MNVAYLLAELKILTIVINEGKQGPNDPLTVSLFPPDAETEREYAILCRKPINTRPVLARLTYSTISPV